MAARCPFFGKCGGCKYDFAAADYQSQKAAALPSYVTGAPVWIAPGARRRADFCFAGGAFGFYQAGTKNIVPVDSCPNLAPEINAMIPGLRAMPWAGTGAALVTLCDNGIDVAVTSNIPFCTPEFRVAAGKLPVLRLTWNGRPVVQNGTPTVSFGDKTIEFPSGAFLQPTIAGADAMRDMVVRAVAGARRVADLFCGIGNFTFATNADGFDIVGCGMTRDLFKKPLTVGMLNTYDCVIMDPPRAGAREQCGEIIKSNVVRIVYVSCNPVTFRRDMAILTRGGYRLTELTPVDQFRGSAHWELVAVFDK